MPDPGTDLLIGIGGAVVGGLTTWAAVAGKIGGLAASLRGIDARADRHEQQDDDRFQSIDGKLDRVLDALAGKRRRTASPPTRAMSRPVSYP
jgi:hypothetical protein